MFPIDDFKKQEDSSDKKIGKEMSLKMCNILIKSNENAYPN